MANNIKPIYLNIQAFQKQLMLIKKSWRKESNESPLLFFTRNQANKLDKKIGNEKIM